MSALFDITQNTLGPGLGPGEAREDGVPGELVTITIQDPTVQEVQVLLEWTPPDDEVAFYNLAVNPVDIKEWTFTPDVNAVNASGTYLIHVITDASNPARRDEALLAFVITTPNSDLVIPALNEPGNPLASLTQPDAPGAANNVPFLGPGRNVAGSPIADIDFAAWWKAMSSLILVVDGFSGGAGEVNTGVDVGTGVGISDGANIGVQLPMRSVGGINDVGVALNGQTIEVDGVALLDLTAVRHLVGPDDLTLQYVSPMIILTDEEYGTDVGRRFGIESRDPDGPPQFRIGAVDDSENLVTPAIIIDRDDSNTQDIREVRFEAKFVEVLVGVSGDGSTGGLVISQDGNTSATSDNFPIITLRGSGTFFATSVTKIGDRNPVGNIDGSPGDFYVRADAGVASSYYQHTGASADNTSWIDIGGGSAGLQGAYGAGPSILLAGNTPISVTVPIGHTAAALDINLDSTFAPATAGDGAVLFRDDGVNRMYLGESPAFGFGLFTIGTGADMFIAPDTDGALSLVTLGSGILTVAAGGTGDASFGSEGGAVTLSATVGSTTVKAEVDLTLEATTGAFALDVGGVTGVLSVTAAGVTTLRGGGGLGSLVFGATGATTVTSPLAYSVTSAAGGMSLTATTGTIDILSLEADPGGNISIVSAQADLTLISSLGTTILQGAVLNLISDPGAFALTVNSNQVMDVTAAGAIALISVSGQPAKVEAQGSGALTLINSGTGSADLSATAGDVTITAGVDMTQTVTGSFALDVQGNSLLAQAAAGAVTLQSWNDDTLSIISNGTGGLNINGGLGLVSIIGAAITLSSGAGSDINVTANGAGNLFLNAVGDDIALDSLNLGFYGVTAAPRPDITGSRAAGVALTNLLTALDTLGLITDSSTI